MQEPTGKGTNRALGNPYVPALGPWSRSEGREVPREEAGESARTRPAIDWDSRRPLSPGRGHYGMARQPPELTEQQQALGRNLAALRKAAGLYQTDIARAVPCHRTNVAHAEAGSQLLDAHSGKRRIE